MDKLTATATYEWCARTGLWKRRSGPSTAPDAIRPVIEGCVDATFCKKHRALYASSTTCPDCEHTENTDDV